MFYILFTRLVDYTSLSRKLKEIRTFSCMKVYNFMLDLTFSGDLPKKHSNCNISSWSVVAKPKLAVVISRYRSIFVPYTDNTRKRGSGSRKYICFAKNYFGIVVNPKNNVGYRPFPLSSS